MRNLEQFLADYRTSHSNRVNSAIHMICVPAIFFSTLGLLWLVPAWHWLGLEESSARLVNGATLFAVPAAIFYLRLSLGSLVAMTLWFAASVAAFIAIEGAGWSLAWISIGLWASAWLLQLYGHSVEGAKPSFANDLLFLLIGPLFVMEKVRRRAATH